MIPETHKAIQPIVCPLSGNVEQQLVATNILQERLLPDAKPYSGRLFLRGKWAAIVILVLAICATTFCSLNTYNEVRIIGAPFSFLGAVSPSEFIPIGDTEEERLLFSNGSQTELQRSLKLHQLRPENPAYFTDYVLRHVSEHSELPADYFETIERIAPQNSYFYYYAAGVIGRASVEKDSASSPNPSNRNDPNYIRPPSNFKITDQAAFEQALELIKKASSLPEYTNYSGELLRKRAAFMPTGNLAELVGSLTIVLSEVSDIKMLRLADILAKWSSEPTFQDRQRLEQIINHLNGSLQTDESPTLVNALLAKVTILENNSTLYHRSVASGDSEKTDFYKEKVLRFRKEFVERRSRMDMLESVELERSSSLLTFLTLPMVAKQVTSPPPLDATTLQPLREAEYFLASRVSMTAAAILLIFAAATIYSLNFIRGKLIREIAAQFCPRLQLADYAKIFLITAILPVATVLGLSLFTPLGLQEFGMKYLFFAYPAAAALIIVFNTVILTFIYTRRKLTAHLEEFSTVPTSRWAFLPLAIGNISVLLIVPLLFIYSEQILAQRVGAGLAVLFLSALGLHILLGYIRPDAFSQFVQAATLRAMPPLLGLAALFLCTITPIFEKMERHWVAQDTLLGIDSTRADLGFYESRVATQHRKETQELIDGP